MAPSGTATFTDRRTDAIYTLAQVCGWGLADITLTGRRSLEKAFTEIEDRWDGAPDHLACEIVKRARMYFVVLRGYVVTPKALAKHWDQLPGMFYDEYLPDADDYERGHAIRFIETGEQDNDELDPTTTNGDTA